MKSSILSFFLLFFLLCSNLAWAATWFKVTQFTGSGNLTTDHFSCSHEEWRINWSYTANSDYPEQATFTMDVYPSVINSTYIAEISQNGNTNTSGTKYIHNLQGDFYLKFLVANVSGYTAVIEQDITSIPEFSPMILLFLFAVGTLAAVTLTRKPRKNPSLC